MDSKRIFQIILFCVFSFALSAQTFTGKAINSLTNKGVPFVKVGFPSLGIFTQTDSIGNFTFESIPHSHLTIKTIAIGYKDYSKEIDLSTQKSIVLKLIPIHAVFDEIDVESERSKIKRENVASLSIASKDKLFQNGATTIGEALIQIPGVQSASEGVGISKPVIRGLSGLRVVTYINGLRIANQQWGDDHGSAGTKIGIGQVSIIKGPASLLYGSDAIGGVIHFMDQEYADKGKTDGFISTKFESNSLATESQAGFRTAKKNWSINAFAGYSNSADYRIPNGKAVKNTRYWRTNFKTDIGFHKKNYILNLRYQLSYNRIGIPGESEKVAPLLSDFLTNHQNRKSVLPAQHILNNFLSIENELFFKRSKLMFNIGNTNNDLQEFGDDKDVPDMHLNLNNTTYDLRYTYHITEDFHLLTGWQGMAKINRNLFPAASMIIPNANSFDNGVYALLDYKIGKWHLQGGVRYDTRYLNVMSSKGIDTAKVEANINLNALARLFQGINYAAGFARNGKHTTIRINISSGYRAPSLSELLINGVHEGTLRYEKGDENLHPEVATQIDASLKIHYEHFELLINPYFNRIGHFIDLKETGASIENYPVYAFNQAHVGYFYGFEVGFHVHPHHLHRLHISSYFSATFAEKNDGSYVNLIPQPDIVSSIRFDINNKGFISFKNIVLEHIYYLPQRRVGAFETPSVDYHLLSLVTHFTLGKPKKLRFAIGVRNILNTHYTNHLSVLKNKGIPNPGINGFISIHYQF